jgi:SWIM zinc finger
VSIIITPSPAHLRREPTPVGRLAASLLSVTVAGLADPQRFRRGKVYLAEHAVTRLELSPGVLLATVVGGRPEPYDVTITVEAFARPDDLGQVPERSHVARLIPRGEELLCSCTCPDWDDPCKHGVAALLALAGELGSRPELLATWRCGEADGTARTRVGSRARTDRHLRLVPPTPPTSPFETPEWREFAGDDLAIPHIAVATEALTLPTMHLDRTDVTDVIRSAWRALARFSPENDPAADEEPSRGKR